MTTATLTRSKSGARPEYKEYVSFLDSYRGGKKDDQSSDSGVSSVRSFPLSNNTSSSSLSSTDVADYVQPACQSYGSFLENSKSRKFNSVKLAFENAEKPPPKKTVKSELFIQISNGDGEPKQTKVSEVSKIFENKSAVKKPPTKINDKINIFERKNASPPPPKAQGCITPPPPPPLAFRTPPLEDSPSFPPPPPPLTDDEELRVPSPNFSPPPPPPMFEKPKIAEKPATPPPPMVIPPPPQFATTKNPVPAKNVIRNASFSGNPSTTNGRPQIDRNDPMVRKLVYGTLRGMYGAYHEKANDIVATMPKNMVRKDNGIQNIIDVIASNGGLDKLNGRANPKVEQD